MTAKYIVMNQRDWGIDKTGFQYRSDSFYFLRWLPDDDGLSIQRFDKGNWYWKEYKGVSLKEKNER